MNLTPEQAAAAAEGLACPTCAAPAGSPCRTGGGDTAFRYHTPRFLPVPALRDEVEVPVPEDRGPGRPWTARPPLAPSPAHPAPPVRIGYAGGSTGSPQVRPQLDALRGAGCGHLFSDVVGARVAARPGLEQALRLAADARRATPDRPVVLAVHRLDRLARTATELVSVATRLQADGVQVHLLTGPLAGTYDPSGTGGLFFAVLAAAAELDRGHRREATLEGQWAAAAHGHRGGRPRVLDEGMLATARALRDQGVPVPEIAARLVITSGRNAGRHPSLASVYRALAGSQVPRPPETHAPGPRPPETHAPEAERGTGARRS